MRNQYINLGQNSSIKDILLWAFDVTRNRLFDVRDFQDLENRVSGLESVPSSGLSETFETVNKNLKSWDYALNYTGSNLTSIVYTDGVDTITKTLNYTGSDLTSIVLSGDTPSGIDLTKTLTYTGADLTGVAYS